LISAVQGDRYSIGICNITDVLGSNNHSIIEDVKILPIDKNGNGKIDYKEDVYADLNTFARGVWIGKYPRALSNNIYSVAASNPTNESEIAFLKWIITGGQVLLDNHGFSHLENTEQMAQIKWIDSFDGNRPGSGNYTIPKEPGFFSKPLPLFLAILLVVVLWIILRTRYLNKRSEGVPVHIQVPRLAFNEKSVEILPGLYYDKSHTWAFMDEDGMVKVGIDDFLQHVTGSLTRIKMKSPGERIKKGKLAVSIIQDGKQLDICAPVSGTIKEQNKKLTKNISILNSYPHAEGWIYKIEPTNWLKEVQVLFMGSTYREWLKTEFGRLKAFLMDSMRPGRIEYAHVLQDGGELYDHILEDLGPEEWEDFQTNFIDVSS
jgi:glycine cleavage system H lipoate-binding protein